MVAESLRAKNINKISGGSFDVVIIGNGLYEAAIFASLAARGLPVALISSKDFVASTNSSSPGLLGAGISSFNRKFFSHGNETSFTKTRLLKSNPSGISTRKYLSLVTESNDRKLSKLAFQSVAQSKLKFLGADKPRFIRRNAIPAWEPLVRDSNAKGAVEHSLINFKDNEWHYGLNLITRSMSSSTAAINYASVVNAEKKESKPWEITIVDHTDSEQYLLSAKVVVQNQNSLFSSDAEGSLFGLMKVKTESLTTTHFVLPKDKLPLEKYIDISDDVRGVRIGPYKSNTIISTNKVCNNEEELSLSDEIKSALSKANSQLSLDKDIKTTDIITSWQTSQLLVYPSEKEGFSNLSPSPAVDVEVTKRLVRFVGGNPANFLHFAQRINKIINQLGIDIKPSRGKYFGEPAMSQRKYFLEIAKEVGLDRAPYGESSSDSLAEIMWNRHWSKAFKLIGLLEETPELVAPIYENKNLIWAELPVFRDNDMITCLEDFYFRRTDLGHTLSPEVLLNEVSAEQLKIALGIADIESDAGFDLTIADSLQ